MRLTEEEYQLAKYNQNMTMDELKEQLKDLNLTKHAEIVGKWLWLKFDVKPSEDVLKEVQLLGFQWSNKRQAWLHRCGNAKTRRSPHDPRAKYGVRHLEEDEAGY